MLRSSLLGIALALQVASAGSAADQPDRREETAAPMPQLPPAAFDESLAIGGEEIGARKLRSRMTVDVRINDRGPYKFVVDSGADSSVVGEQLAGRLALPAGEPALLHGVTESKVVDRVLVDELTLGPTATTLLELPVLDERDIGADGMIGLDALVEQRLMIDFDERIITVDDGFTPLPQMEGVIVVTGRLQRGQLILTEVRVGREKVDAVVDTGSEITIGNSALRDTLKLRRGEEFGKVEVTGVTGKDMELDFLLLRKLKLGPVELRNVPIAFADVPPFAVFGLGDRPALLLGTDLMESFRRVSLDFHDRKVRFQLKKCTKSAVMLRTSVRPTRLSTDKPTACAR